MSLLTFILFCRWHYCGVAGFLLLLLALLCRFRFVHFTNTSVVSLIFFILFYCWLYCVVVVLLFLFLLFSKLCRCHLLFCFAADIILALSFFIIIILLLLWSSPERSFLTAQRMPKGRKKFEEALQVATKKQLLFTVWGPERRFLLDVDPPYLVTMSKRLIQDWQVHTHTLTHTHTHTRTHTHAHAHTHTLTHTHTHAGNKTSD